MRIEVHTKRNRQPYYDAGDLHANGMIQILFSLSNTECAEYARRNEHIAAQEAAYRLLPTAASSEPYFVLEANETGGAATIPEHIFSFLMSLPFAI